METSGKEDGGRVSNQNLQTVLLSKLSVHNGPQKIWPDIPDMPVYFGRLYFFYKLINTSKFDWNRFTVSFS